MRTFIFLLCTATFGFTPVNVLSQNVKIKIDRDKTLAVDEVFKLIKDQTDYRFIYQADMFKDYPKVAVKKGTIKANKLLEKSLSSGDFDFELSENNTIVIKEKRKPIITQQTIKGTVINENGEHLMGVTIIVLETDQGTVSDFDGSFSINANVGDELTFSYIGYIKQTVKVENLSPLIVTLKESTNSLDEVVVTGYYSLPRERATGSFSHVKTEELEKITSLSIKDKIEGVVPGLLFEPNYASDQSPTTDRSRGLIIRGASTLGDNSPLIVVDGFPVISSDGVDPWSTINPNDVASLTVLKDAAAASIWGAQAANGVIVIKTKTGNLSKKARIDLAVEFIAQPKPDLFEIPFASSAESIDIYKSLFLEYNYYDQLLTPFFRNRYEFPEVIDVLLQMKAGEISQQNGNQRLSELSKIDVRREFSDLFYRKMETNKKVNVSFSKGDETNRLRASIMALQSDKFAFGDANEQFIGNLNNTFKPVDWFSVSFGMNFSILKQEKNGVAIGELNNIPQMSRILDENGDYLPMIKNDFDDTYYDVPTQRRRDLVDQYNLPYDWDWNLKRDIDNKNITDEKNDLRLNAKVSFIPIKGLNIDLSYQYQRNASLYSNYMNEDSWYVRNAVNEFARPDGSFPIPAGGMLYEQRSSFTSNDGRIQVGFNRTFKDHHIRLLGGFEIRKDYYESLPYGFYGYDPQALTQITGLNFQDEFNPRMTGDREWRGSIPPIPTIAKTSVRIQGRDNRFVSYYGNGVYTYKNKYDLTGSIRLDKTNLYGRTPSYRNLPQWSLGMGWSIDQESFFDVNEIDRLRLRTSYGWNGHIDKSASPYINGTPWVDPVNQSQYAAVLTTPNPGLTWEKTKTYNIGVDFSLFDQRFQGGIEYYNKQSEDVLTDIAVNPTYGFYYDEATLNAGDISNKGIEFDINALVIDKEVKWSSALNFSYNKNEVQNVKSTSANIASRTSLSQFYPVAGQPVDFLAVAEWAGYSNDGLPQVYLDGVVTEITDISYSGVDVDKLFKFVGQRSPKTFGSWTNSIKYKNFELSARLLYSFGHKFLKDSPPRNLLYNYQSYRTFHTFNTDLLVDRWRSPADNETASMYSLDKKVASYTTTLTNDYIAQYNTQNVLDAGQIRLQNISLAYHIPTNFLGGVRNAKVQFQAKNLGPIFLKNKEGVDPSFPKYSSSLYSAYYNVIRDRPEYSISLLLNL